MNDEQIEETRVRAYLIWESEGRPEGRHEAHWAAAERDADEAEPVSKVSDSPKWAPKAAQGVKQPGTGGGAKPAPATKPDNRPNASNQAAARI